MRIVCAIVTALPVVYILMQYCVWPVRFREIKIRSRPRDDEFTLYHIVSEQRILRARKGAETRAAAHVEKYCSLLLQTVSANLLVEQRCVFLAKVRTLLLFCTSSSVLAQVILRGIIYARACDAVRYPLGQVIIRGNEEPLTIGLPRDLNCMWSGEGNVSTIEWFVVGLEAMAIETATETTSVVLALTPDDDGLDGAMLLCKVTLSSGQEAEETITLSVQGATFLRGVV